MVLRYQIAFDTMYWVQKPDTPPPLRARTHHPRTGPKAAPSVSRLTDDLRLLETERDEAVKVGEECARTVVKLEEMVGPCGPGWGAVCKDSGKLKEMLLVMGTAC